MSNLPFGWRGPGSLAVELSKPFKSVALQLAWNQRPMFVTIWRSPGKHSNTASLTLIANVKNDNGGTFSPSSFSLYIDGASVSLGTPITLTPGNHKATSAKVPGYATTTWGYQCPSPGDGNITLNKGDNKTCVIVYDDIPPPAPACVDTVLMLSGHMTGVGAIAAEASAVKSFIAFTASHSPTSLVGVGSFGGYDGSAAAIPASGALTSSYGINGYATVTAIKYPTATGTPSQWKTAANAYINDTLFATSSANGAQQAYGKFGISLPANAQITGIEVVASDKISLSSGSPKLDVALSWNNGTNMTTSKSVALTTTEASSTLGNSSDTWGRAWTPAEMNDSNFSVIIKHNALNGRIISINYVTLKVYYSVPSTGLYAAVDSISSTINSSFGNDISAAISVASTELGSARHRPACNKVLVLVSDGSNNTAGKTAALNSSDAAKLSGIEIYTIHFGNPPSARDFVASIASGTAPVVSHQPGSFDDTSNSQTQSVIDAENGDGDHFFISPDPSQFGVIFNQIGTIVFAGIGSPPPPPTRATLIVTTHVINDNGGPALPGDFLMTISPSLNASPISPFAGVDLPGVTVTVDPGSYVVSESSSFSGYIETDGFGCSGTISAGDIISCTILNDDVTPPPPPPPPPPPEIGIGPWEEASSTVP